ncbi:MAG: sulfotransferase [Polyangiales bacterium]
MTGQAKVAAQPEVDFLLIGAQKSATTSLWHHIAAHPATFVPATKEIEFFSDPRRFEKGIDWYWQTYFDGAPPAACKGEATTQYMMFPAVPGRIRRAFPDVKMIALLRNPIDRAQSHHRMSSMRGHESRSFEESIDPLLRDTDHQSAAIDPNRDYLRLGEYGRILADYLAHFPREQFCVLFTEDLEADPARLSRLVYEFLEIDPAFRPDTLEKRFNVSGQQAFPRGVELLRRAVGMARRTPLVGRLITQDRYDAFKFWTRTELQVRVAPNEGLDSAAHARLVDHFAPDVERLRSAFGVDPPWPEFMSRDTNP